MTELEHLMLAGCFGIAVGYLVGSLIASVISLIYDLVQARKIKKRLAKEKDEQ